MWEALPPEVNSSRFWFGPGAGTFFTSAAQLEALAGAIIGWLGGSEAVAALLGTAWASPTGDIAVASNVPYQVWAAKLAGMLTEAAAAIQTAGESFETSKAATPTPGEVDENQAEHVALQQANIPALGMLTPLIVANRARYSEMWVRSASNVYDYAAASVASVGSIPPVEPPPPSAIPAGMDPGGAAQLAAQQPIQQALAGDGAPEQTVSTVMPLLSQLGQLPSSLGQVAQAPMGAVQGLGSLPQQALQPLTSLTSRFGSLSGVDGLGGAGDAAAADSWVLGMPAAGGPVSAGLAAGGGAGGFSGGGLGAGVTALRGPVSWSSTVASAPGAAESAEPVSRIAQARAAATMPAESSAMGGSGAMMGPMMAGHGGASQAPSSKSETAKRDVLAAAAQFYRAPDAVPVVTGAGGAQFVTAGEGGR